MLRQLSTKGNFDLDHLQLNKVIDGWMIWTLKSIKLLEETLGKYFYNFWRSSILASHKV